MELCLVILLIYNKAVLDWNCSAINHVFKPLIVWIVGEDFLLESTSMYNYVVGQTELLNKSTHDVTP